MPELLIRDVQAADHDEWVRLSAGYRDFSRLAPDPDADRQLPRLSRGRTARR